MRSSLSLGQMATVLLSVSPLASAWNIFPTVDSVIVRRQDTSAEQPKETGTPDPKNGPSLNTGKVEDPKSSNPNATTTATKSKQTFGNENYPASIVMLTPAVTLASPLYSMGAEITFSWNYTGLLATPTALNILAAGVDDKATYTLTANMTFPTNGPTEYKWDTRTYISSLQGKELMTEQYDLQIFDSEGSMTSQGEPGYLAPFTMRFGLYKGQPYQSKNDGWFCSSCSAAGGDGERRAIGMALFMSTMTVVGFTWFVTGSLL